MTRATPSDAAPARTRPGPLAWLLLALSYLLFLLCVWGPLGLGFLVFGLLLFWLGAAHAALHSGGLALPIGWFNGISLIALVGVLLLLWRGARCWSRKRTLGPGGRVISVTVSSGWRWPRLPPRLHLAALALLLVVVYLGEWDGNPWLPDPLALAVLLFALYGYSAGFALGVLHGLVTSTRGLWCFAGRSATRALVCAGLFLGAVVIGVGDGREHAAGLAKKLESQDAPASHWDGARDVLIVLADEIDPVLSLREDLRQAFSRALTGSAGPLVRGATSEGRSRYAGDFIGDVEGRTVEDEARWQECLRILYTGKLVHHQQRVLESQFHQLDRDQVYDITMGALVRVCLYASAKAFDNLTSVYKVATARVAIDQIRRQRGGYGSLCQGAAPEEEDEYVDRCPAPGISPEDLAALRMALAQKSWCALSDPQLKFIFESDFLGYSDREIAKKHDTSETYIKDTRNNGYKKIRKRLHASCL